MVTGDDGEILFDGDEGEENDENEEIVNEDTRNIDGNEDRFEE